MPSLARLFLVLVCMSAASLAAPPSEAVAYLENLPASNPCREILLRFAHVPETDRHSLQAWADADSIDPFTPVPTVSDEQLSLARELTSELVALSRRPAITAADWPIPPNPDDPDNPAAVTLPTVGLVRELTRLAVKTADSLPATAAIDAYAATAQLGRQQRAGATLIEQLTGLAMENTAFAAAGRRLADLSAADLRHLSEAWSALHPLPSNEQALAGERDVFFVPMIENVIRPGLHALLTGSDGPSADAGFTRDLRLSALVDLGDGERQVSLENITEDTTLTLRENAVVEGIRLVRLDFENRLAVIQRGDQEAVVNLQSREIIERRRAADQLREMFNAFDWMNGEGSGKAALEATLLSARSHPEGIDGYTRDLLKNYQLGIDQHLAAASSAKFDDNAVPPPDDPMLAISMPMIGRMIRTMNCAATQPAMLQAAIHHRLDELNQSTDPFAHRDPWSDDSTPFTHEPTPDGGFLLRSRYETHPDAPLTYKFAAPDAGFVRSK